MKRVTFSLGQSLSLRPVTLGWNAHCIARSSKGGEKSPICDLRRLFENTAIKNFRKKYVASLRKEISKSSSNFYLRMFHSKEGKVILKTNEEEGEDFTKRSEVRERNKDGGDSVKSMRLLPVTDWSKKESTCF
ncbi:hypothetical protein CEXT_742081 [Caerostris extrusa]|uniref:Uncharacterized protein n=1 Tax=Caerostris extrusa TaxID=172846 RepID=A0AAV4SFY5_CAEEX|nr:hypothetical protein CEXT_742081 [Caerostris extrusa]